MIAEIVRWLVQGQVCLLRVGLGRVKQMYGGMNERRTSGRLVNLFDRGRLRDHCRAMTPSPQLLSLPLKGFFVFIYTDVRRQPKYGEEKSTYTSAIISFMLSLRFEASALRAFFPNAILSCALVYSAYSGMRMNRIDVIERKSYPPSSHSPTSSSSRIKRLSG